MKGEARRRQLRRNAAVERVARWVGGGLIAVLVLGACATPSDEHAPAELAAFSSDGCSMFPDASPGRRTDWCHCCLAHDLAYWRGGTAPQRLAADEALKSCVLAATASTLLAEAMFAGVRAGGEPHFDTDYRWGYGWPPGRGYRPLSALEAAGADRHAQQYPGSKSGLPIRG